MNISCTLENSSLKFQVLLEMCIHQLFKLCSHNCCLLLLLLEMLPGRTVDNASRWAFIIDNYLLINFIWYLLLHLFLDRCWGFGWRGRHSQKPLFGITFENLILLLMHHFLVHFRGFHQEQREFVMILSEAWTVCLLTSMEGVIDFLVLFHLWLGGLHSHKLTGF